eukprot:1154239-Pelagomonas_calceolata.AAC.12
MLNLLQSHHLLHSWKQLGVAWEMCAGGTSASSSSCPTGMRVSWPNERLRLKLADLPQLHRMLAQQAQHVQQGVVPVGQCMFDYLGLVVGVGPVRLSGECGDLLAAEDPHLSHSLQLRWCALAGLVEGGLCAACAPDH